MGVELINFSPLSPDLITIELALEVHERVYEVLFSRVEWLDVSIDYKVWWDD